MHSSRGRKLRGRFGFAVIAAMCILVSSFQILTGPASSEQEGVPSLGDDISAQQAQENQSCLPEGGATAVCPVPALSDGCLSELPGCLNLSDLKNETPSTMVFADRIVYTYESEQQKAMIPNVGDYVTGFDQSGSTRIVREIVADNNSIIAYTDPSGQLTQEGGDFEDSTYELSSSTLYTPNILFPTLNLPINASMPVSGYYGYAQIDVTGRLFLKSSACLNVNIGWCGLDSAALIFFVDMQASLSIHASDTLIWNGPLYYREIPVCSIYCPFPITVSVYWGVDFSIRVTGEATLNATASASKAIGIVYSHGQWDRYDPEGNFTVTPTISGPEIDADLNLSTPFGVKSNVFGVGGPYVSVVPYVRAHFTINPSGIDYGIFVGVKVVAGLRIQIWIFVIAC
jgi:hypothetical protein